MRGLLPILLAALVGLASCASRGELKEAGPESSVAERLTFTGVRSVSRAELLEALAEDIEAMRRYGLDKAAVDDVAYGLREHFRSLGYPDAQVSYLYSPEDGGSARFSVVEGPRVTIDEVVVQGVHDLPYRDLPGASGPRDIERFIKPVERGFFGRRKPVPYVAAEVERACDDLRGFLREGGYLDAVVHEPETTFRRERGEVDLRVVVEPGLRYYLDAVRFSYVPLVEEGTAATPRREEGPIESERETRGIAAVTVLAERLANLRTTLIGSAYAPYVAWTLRAQVVDLFRRHGHPDCLVLFEEQRLTERVILTYSIDPGPLVRIGAVRLEGLAETEESFARDRVDIEPGSLYDAKAVREAFRSLYRTGVFESVRVELEEGDEHERDLAVSVVEAPSRELFIEPGYGSYERLRVLIGGKERNLFGTGKVLGAETRLGERAQGGKLSLTDPWLFNQDLVGTGAIFADRREEPSFTLREVGASAGVTKEWTDKLSTTWAYQFRLTRLSDVAVGDGEAQEALDDFDVSSLALTLTWDARDDVFVPTSGSRLRTIVEWAGDDIGSQLDFLRLKLDGSHFLDLDEDRVLGAGVSLGVIWPIGETQVIPLQERFFNGGEDTVRSFQEDELGPKDSDGDPVGGEGFTVASLELRQRLLGNLELALFTDTGHVSSQAGDVLSGDDYAWAVGLGLRYLLPIGPVRVDGAFNPDAGSGEDDFVLHFAVGMSF